MNWPFRITSACIPGLMYVMCICSIPACQAPQDVGTANEDVNRTWWKEAIVYQIYPRSFQDSDGDGIGDLQGIVQRLDYIKELGVDAVWLNPIYASPNADNGYDISDYREIMPEFGTMADFDTLLAGLHARGIKFVMDVVVNHSSDQHPWFKASRSSRDNPYRNYYHWWPAERGKPNYRYSLFDPKGDAWKYDSLTDAYYLHYFAYQQPDLNWENPRVRQEVYDIMTFWAEKGVDGFRLDAFQFVAKDTTFGPLPEGYEHNFIQYYGMQPGIHDYLREMHDKVLSRYDVFAVAEGAGSTFEDAHSLVDADRQELQVAYHFEGMDIGNSLDRFTVDEFREVYTRWDSAFSEEGWLAVFLANHDVPRMTSKFGNDSPAFRDASNKMLNTFILTMRGTPFCYYGDELGMTNIGFDSISQYQDIVAHSGYEKVVNAGGDIPAYLARLKFLSRDNGRTPMQWDTTRYAGFSDVQPWLPVNQNFITINVQREAGDSSSCLSYFRRLTQLRKEHEVLTYGAYTLLLPDHPDIYAYQRTLGSQQLIVLLNFSDEDAHASLPGTDLPEHVWINNYDHLDLSDDRVTLLPYQAVVLGSESPVPAE